MIRKKYAVAVLAIVSILLGALFYKNITQAQTGRLRIYRESVRITPLPSEGLTEYDDDDTWFRGGIVLWMKSIQRQYFRSSLTQRTNF
jgi:hypothetical protein